MCFLRRRFLKAPASFPHISKIHRNLHILLSMGTSIDVLEKLLLEKNRLPKKSGPVNMYPTPDFLVRNYGNLLEEILIETAVFIRGHDDFWNNKDAGWSKILKRICGTAEYTHGEKETINLGLREACDKVIHHTGFDIGNSCEEETFCVFLSGKKQNREWTATIDIAEFCFIGLTFVG